MSAKFSLAGLTRPGTLVHRRQTWDDINPPRNTPPQAQHSPLSVQNRIRVQVVGPDEHGRQVTKSDKLITEGNIMCTYGLSRLVALLAGGAMDCSSWIAGMRIGTDSTVATSNDNSLNATTGSNAITGAGDITEAGARTLRCVATFASDNPAGAAQIREIGLYASSNVTTGLVARKDLTGAQSVNKGASDSINVSYDVVLTTA